MLEHINHHFTVFLFLFSLLIFVREDLVWYSANELVVESTRPYYMFVDGPEFIKVVIVSLAILFIIENDHSSFESWASSHLRA